MSIEKKLLGTTPVSGAVDPEGVSFDGTNDYLSRSSALSGSSDTVKTLTLSAWVYYDPIPAVDSAVVRVLDIRQGSSGHVALQLRVGSYGTAAILAEYGSSWGYAINDIYNDSSTPDAGVPQSGWNHILYSVDLNNTTSSMYINDVLANPSTDGGSLANQPMLFTTYGADINVGRQYGGNYYMKGRLAHVFLDYTYRDLSTVSNRRLFIDSDGKPSDTIPSSPILYLPMTDAATAGSNSGTGGDFTVNGVLDTAGRAPNQFNCSASEFDGSNDYLSKSGSIGSDGKEFTFNCVLNTDSTSYQRIFDDQGDTYGGMVIMFPTGYIQLSFQASGGSNAFVVKLSNAITVGKTISFSLSVDLTSTANRHVFVNGVDLSADSNTTWDTYTNTNMAFASFTGTYLGHRNSGGYPQWMDGSIGEFYFDTSYTDLSTDNPFWDADANRPKPVRQVISETGTTPLIALPLRGNDAGNNLGSGGDFTVNSAPFTGARGGSEFWARSANFNSSSEWLRDSSPSISDSKFFSFVCSFKRNNALGDGTLLRIRQGAGDGDVLFSLMANSNGRVYTDSYSSTQQLLGSYTGEVIVVDTWYTVFLSIDLNSTSNRSLVIEGVASPAQSWNTYVDGTVDFSSATYSSIHLVHSTSGDSSDIDVAFLYFNTAYIDFSQESNRNLFVDQLGYPKDLTPAIEAGTIADPLIYMKFDDTSALGTNSGTGGNFTVTGTVTAGADVDPNA